MPAAAAASGGGSRNGSGAAGAAGVGAKMTMALLATFAVGIAVGVARGPRALAEPGARRRSPPRLALPTPRAATDGDAGAHAAGDRDRQPGLTPRCAEALAPVASTAPQRAAGAASTEALSSRGSRPSAPCSTSRGPRSLEARRARHSRDGPPCARLPDGALVEEREAIAVKALVALGRKDEARTRVHALEQRFPRPQRARGQGRRRRRAVSHERDEACDDSQMGRAASRQERA